MNQPHTPNKLSIFTGRNSTVSTKDTMIQVMSKSSKFNAMLSRRAYSHCSHTAPHIGPIGTSASTRGPFATPVDISFVPPQTAAVDQILQEVQDTRGGSLPDHPRDEAHRHHIRDNKHYQKPENDYKSYKQVDGCPCGRRVCKGKHREILQPYLEPLPQQWIGLPELVYEGIVKNLDYKSLLSFRLACRE